MYLCLISCCTLPHFDPLPRECPLKIWYHSNNRAPPFVQRRLFKRNGKFGSFLCLSSIVEDYRRSLCLNFVQLSNCQPPFSFGFFQVEIVGLRTPFFIGSLLFFSPSLPSAPGTVSHVLVVPEVPFRRHLKLPYFLPLSLFFRCVFSFHPL